MPAYQPPALCDACQPCVAREAAAPRPRPRDRTKTMLVMVGLPARGKTYIARKVARYLAWIGWTTQVFNVGSYRRELLGPRQPAAFFDPTNPDGERLRRAISMRALDDALAWFDAAQGDVAIYDATNSTGERRRGVERRCREQGVEVVFIESICDDPAVIDANVRETKLSMPDYADMDEAAAVSDFRARIAHYARVYEPLDDRDGRFIKIIDVGRKVVLHEMRGHLPGRIVPLLLNLHLAPRPIWLTRHGESEFNVRGLIGGDAGLSRRGAAYAEELARFIRGRAPPGAPVVVWTSTLRRTIETARPLTREPETFRAFDEIDAGICDGMTYEQIRGTMPEVYAARKADKLRYRYPRGESYEDVIQRLEPMIIQLERQRSPVLLIAHRAVLRAVFGYLLGRPPAACPKLDIPLHQVIELTPTAYGCKAERIELPPSVRVGHADLGAGF